jgi:hypothetical protein
METCEASLDEAEDLGGRLEGGEIDDVGAEGIGDGLVEALLGDDAEIDEGGDDVFTGGVDFLEGVFSLGFVNDALVNEEFDYGFCVHRREGWKIRNLKSEIRNGFLVDGEGDDGKL